MSVFRSPWGAFPVLWIHASEGIVKSNPDYHAAKTGDPHAAVRLVHALACDDCLSSLAEAFAGERPVLVSAHAVEKSGLNAIPQALAGHLGMMLSWEVEIAIVQTNVVGHTGADGFSRLAKQAEFDGTVVSGAHYLLVDDFVGQGGTLANLRGFLIRNGGIVLGGTVLTGKTYSATLRCDETQIQRLREKHGLDLESWWFDYFGFGYECLTRSEAHYLLNTPTAQRVRNRIAAAREGGDTRDHH